MSHAETCLKKFSRELKIFVYIIIIIIKITISSIAIGLKRILFSTNSQFVNGQINKPITFKVVVQINESHSKLQFKSTNLHFRVTRNNLFLLCQYFNTNFPFLSELGYSFFLGNCNF